MWSMSEARQQADAKGPSCLLKEVNMPQMILLAPHDDGFGGYVTMARLAHALLKADPNVRVLFISGKTRAILQQDGFNNPRRVGLIKTDNLLLLPRDPATGSVAPDKIPDLICRISKNSVGWENRVAWTACDGKGKGWPLGWDPEQIGLCISMGVPWVHRAAHRASIPSVEVGDWSVSLVLRGCLEEAGRLTPQHRAALRQIAACECMAEEVWLLPFAAPREYEPYYAEADVPVNWLPGLFGPAGVTPQARTMLVGIEGAIRGTTRRQIVGIHAGKTAVWDGILDALRTRAGIDPADPAFVTVVNNGQHVEVLEPGRKTYQLPVGMPSLIPWYAREDLCLTRGGISALDHIACACPLAITEEAFHWLSHRQREVMVRAGLCIPISSEALRPKPELLARHLLGGRRKECDMMKMKQRMGGIRTDAHEWFAKYLLKRFP